MDKSLESVLEGVKVAALFSSIAYIPPYINDCPLESNEKAIIIGTGIVHGSFFAIMNYYRGRFRY